MSREEKKDETLRRQIGQLMVCGFYGTEPSEEIIRLIRDHHVGGVILFARNIAHPIDVLRLTTALQKVAYEAGHERPLLIAIDQENGIVRRLSAGITLLPGNMAVGATGDERNAFLVAEATAKELKALGVNYNLAPVLDVNNNPLNPVIGVRSYGEDPQQVAAFGTQAIHGLQAGGVATCGKHFPGHGDTNKDSHLTLPSIPHDRTRLEQVEMVPFVKAIAEGVDSLMIAHVCFPEIEPDITKPATMSRKVITDLLRGELGFEGVVISDCMEMDAIAKTVGTVEGVYRAFQAGMDLFCVSHTHDWQYEAIERLTQGVLAGDLDAAHLDAAVARVERLKEKYLSWEELRPSFEHPVSVPTLVGSGEHRRLARRMMEEAVTLTRNENGLLPLPLDEGLCIGVVSLENVLVSLVEEDRPIQDDLDFKTPLVRAVARTGVNYRGVEVPNPPTDEQIAKAAAEVAGSTHLIVNTLNASLSPQQVKLIERLQELAVPLIVISMRTPYDLSAFPNVAAHIATYEYTPSAVDVAVEGIFGELPLVGRLPVTIPGAAERGHRAEGRGGAVR